MEFRLIYKGRLPSETHRPRTKDKQRIRKEFHKQFVELWKSNEFLRGQMETPVLVHITPANLVSFPGPGIERITPLPKDDVRGRPWAQRVADEFSRCGYRFLPLVRRRTGFHCSLNILFLRRDSPGNIIQNSGGGGDIDNRIKVLFDALRMVNTCDELDGATPENGEDPFMCLLEDDSLITSVSITTDRLLTPLADGESVNDVELVVHVTLTDPGGLFGQNGLI